MRQSAMRKLRSTFFFLAVALTLSGCGIFGGSDGAAVNVAEDVEAQATVNSVQAVPAQTPTTVTEGVPAQQPDDDTAGAALPTAQTLPPTPEPTVDRSQPTTYIVQSGDVLGLIAERFDADIAELRRVNGLDGNLIRVGQELTIPALDGSTETSAAGDPAATAAPAVPAPTSAPAAPVSCNSNATGYCIQPGDSLRGIALKYDVTLDALRAANPGISGDLIRSGEVLNLPGGTTAPSPAGTASPSTPAVPGGTPIPAAPIGPRTDAECLAANPNFPYFHAADNLCYANPIGPTVIPTSAAAEDSCLEGYFLWNDGLCYPIPGVTVTPTAQATVGTNVATTEDYGTVPCRDGYLPLTNGKCWPEPSTTPATVVPTGSGSTSPTPTAGATGSATTCTAPNFFEDATGNCFLLQEGVDIGCSLEAGQPTCP